MLDTIVPNVLVVTDHSATARVALETMASLGIRGVMVGEAAAAIRHVQSHSWDLVLVDIPGDGEPQIELVRQIRSQRPDLPAVMIGDGSCAAIAVRSMHEGARDYLIRPLTRAAMENTLAAMVPNHSVPMAAADQDARGRAFRIAGRNLRFLEIIRQAIRAAPTSAPVLLTGESGTGKELISYLLHWESPRRTGPYLRVNCASLSETLLESELFGHERGAFTGAVARRKGRFERAHTGTLLLDEISETTPRLQAELLRVLEQQDFERVGGTETVRVNVRIVSTSNRDLPSEIERGRFRRDLYYRLGGVHLVVPPLRDRIDDIPAMVWHFVNLHAGEVSRKIVELDAEMMDMFRQYHWPGNVRQLRNVVRSALIMGEGAVLSLRGVPWLKNELLAAPAPAAAEVESTLRLESLEKQAVLEALRRTQRNQAEAARLLGITDRTLREKLRRYRRDQAVELTGASQP